MSTRATIAPAPRGRDDILVLTSSYPRHADDPAGRFVSDLLEAIDHRFVVLCPDDPAHVEPAAGGIRRERFRNPGVFYGGGALSNMHAGRCGPVGAAVASLSMAHRALSLARSARAVWSHWAVPAGVVGATCRRLLRRPHALLLHSADVFYLERHAAGRRLARFIARHTDHLAGVSPAVIARFEALSGRRGDVLGCGVRMERPPLDDGASSGPPTADAGDGDPPGADAPPGPRAGTLSRLVPSKGVLPLLRRAHELSGSLHVAGDGPERDEVAALCARDPARAVFHGPLVGAAKTRHLAALDAFVAPYRRSAWGQPEGLPVTVLEAMAAATPVVAYAGAVPPGLVVDGETGRLVPDGDEDGLLRAVNELLADRQRARVMGRAARRAAQPWALDSVAHRWQSVLDDLLAAAPPRARSGRSRPRGAR